MDLAQVHDKDSMREMSSCDLLVQEYPEENDNIEEPPMHPHIGDEYQVELPPMRSEPDNLHQTHTTYDSTNMHFRFAIGLAVPVFWVQEDAGEVKAYSNTRICRHIFGLEGSKAHVEGLNFHDNAISEYTARNSENHGQYPEIGTYEIEFMYEKSDQECALIGDTLDIELPTGEQKKSSGFFPVPLLPSASWTDYEMQKFLLGLYVFGRNFIVLRKFVESKHMGDMLAFYYGKFYNSNEFQRWSLYKKVRNRKCVYGRRIFTGWRQQEILSRLGPQTSDEDQSSIQKVMRRFNEEEISFEEYVFTLKDIVGVKALVEAIGIGKGKHDLTGTALDYVKTSQARSNNPKIPKGKACSSLCQEEIIKLITGNFRLSKARSNDLFWEAVWPRLLAKGWHSEEAKDQNYATSKSTLVFLIPGVRKFSRRKLVKGVQYYDSVSDVLNKVASDPSLLKMDAEGEKVSNETQKDLESAMNSPLDDTHRPDIEPQSYLHPKFPSYASDVIKFTIVDTSLVQGAPFKIRELRSLPIDNTCNNSNPSSSDGDSSQGSGHESASVEEESDPVIVDNKKPRKGMSFPENQGVQPNQSNYVFNISTKKRRSKKDSNEKNEDQSGNQIMVGMHHFRRKRSSGKQNFLSPIPKRRRLEACSNSEYSNHTMSFSRRQHFKEEMNCHSEYIDASETFVSEISATQSKALANSLVKKCPNQSGGYAASDNYVATTSTSEVVLSEEKCQRRTLFDLNVAPQCPLDFDASETCEVENANKQDSHASNKNSPCNSHQQLDDSHGHVTSKSEPSEPHVAMNGRRQSTRNRPPTAKALEALASGYLDKGRKVRGYRDPSTYRPSRRARKTIEGSVTLPSVHHDNVTSEVSDVKVGEVDEECSSFTSENGLFINAENAGLAYNFFGQPVSHLLPRNFTE